MQYITAKRFKRQGINGEFNIPYGTTLDQHEDGVLYYQDRPVCVSRSAASHLHFVNNNDNNGLKRYYWTSQIIKKLNGAVRPTTVDSHEEEKEHARLWDVVMHDSIAQKYRKTDHADYWLWDDTFYNGSTIEDLKHIGNIIGIEDGEG